MKLTAKVISAPASVDATMGSYSLLEIEVEYFDLKKTIILKMPTYYYGMLMTEKIDPTAVLKMIEEKINASTTVQ